MELKNNNTNLIHLELGNSKADISLSKGGSLIGLLLNGKEIINDFSKEEPYLRSYASAVLFPFANRIFKGQYIYKKEKYTFDNSYDSEAIHGLLFNKKFTEIKRVTTADNVSVKLLYISKEKVTGFPYDYSVELLYTLYKDKITLDVYVKNEDDKSFPFTIGWHPYFYTENRKDCLLRFDSKRIIIHNEEMIPIAMKDLDGEQNFLIGNQKRDNCYELRNGKASLITSNYSIDVKSSNNNNFLQVYTSEIENYIAIEPVTGIANSFNNKIGLKELSSQETFNIKWTIQLQNG